MRFFRSQGAIFRIRTWPYLSPLRSITTAMAASTQEEAAGTKPSSSEDCFCLPRSSPFSLFSLFSIPPPLKTEIYRVYCAVSRI